MRSAITRKNVLTKTIIYAVLISFSLLCVIPFILILSISFSDEKAISDFGYSIVPRNFTTYAYSYIFKFPDVIINAYQVTILVTAIGTAISLLITAMLAYPLSRNHLKYRNALSFYIFFTLLCNGGMVSWYIITTQYLHLKENIWALIIPYLANSWYILLMRNFFRAVPDALIEAAKLEGAGDFRIFVQIAMPLSKPGLATIALFIALGYWNDWWLGLFLITGNEHAVPLQLLLNRLMSTAQFLQTNPEAVSKGIMIPGESARMATCILVIGPIIFIYPFFQKYFIKGLIVGAVKS